MFDFRVNLVTEEVRLTVIAYVRHLIILVLVCLTHHADHLDELPIVRLHNIKCLLIQHEIRMRLRLVLLVDLNEFDFRYRVLILVAMEILSRRRASLAHSIRSSHLSHLTRRSKLTLFLASHIFHELLTNHFVLLLLVFLEHHSFQILLFLSWSLVNVIVLTF